jgi:outer membrane protein TolC
MVLGTGCQHYEPRPLDLDAHRDAWRARGPGDDSVQAFASQLGESHLDAAFDPADGLTLAEGELVALVYNPDLRLARLRVGVAAATVEHATVWADPEFSLDFLRITEAVSDPWVMTPGLALTIPISGRLEAEKARADAALRVALVEVAEAEWDARVRLRGAWVQWSAAVYRAEQIEWLLDAIGPLVDSTARLAEVGELQPTEAGLFAIEQASQRQALLEARGNAAAWSQKVRALMGLSPEAPVTCLPMLRLEPGKDEPAANLELGRLAEAYEVAEHTLLREIRRQYPDLVIGPLYERDQGQSRIGFFGSLPLPVFNANTQAIAEAKASREVARAAYEIAYERIEGELAAVNARLATATEQRRLLESSVVPLVDRQLATATRLFELGEGGVLVLLESIVQTGRTRLALINARERESLAVAGVAAVGAPPQAHSSSGLTTEGLPSEESPAGESPSGAEPVINALEVIP